MLYYGIVSASVVMFGLQFFFNQMYEREQGNHARGAFLLTLGSNIAGLIVLLIINGPHFSLTPFSVIMALLNGIDGMTFMYCSIKAFGKVNLSKYTVFSMLGGMTLPFFAGLVFFNEEASALRIICFVVIASSLLLEVKDRKNRDGMIYCWGVFICNGMSSVISTVFQLSDYEKCSESEYSVLCSAITALLALAAVIVLKKPPIKKLTGKVYASMAGYGILNRVGNFLLLIALGKLPASVQYPFLTGGVIIVSMIISLFTRQKPTKSEIISVLLAFAGVIALMFV